LKYKVNFKNSAVIFAKSYVDNFEILVQYEKNNKKPEMVRHDGIHTADSEN